MQALPAKCDGFVAPLALVFPSRRIVLNARGHYRIGSSRHAAHLGPSYLSVRMVAITWAVVSPSCFLASSCTCLSEAAA